LPEGVADEIVNHKLFGFKAWYPKPSVQNIGWQVAR
jgi:hypothetical protein